MLSVFKVSQEIVPEFAKLLRNNSAIKYLILGIFWLLTNNLIPTIRKLENNYKEKLGFYRPELERVCRID
jgi:hypothetical protein